MRVRSQGQEDALDEETVTHSSILAWKIPRTDKPGELPSRRVTKSWIQLSDQAHRLPTGKTNQTASLGPPSLSIIMQYVIFLSLKGPQLFPQVNFLSIKNRNHWQKLCKFSICCVSTVFPFQEVASQIPLPFVLGEKRNMGVHICKCKDQDQL